MASPILAQIYSRIQTSPAESLILQIICYGANMFGQNAKLSYEVLAARSNFSARWCMTLVARLEAKRLLRVQRTRLGYAHHAINCYSVVRPWVRELDHREALEKRKAFLRAKERQRPAPPPTAQMSSCERIVHPETTQRENQAPTTEKDCLKAGLSPGSAAWRASLGLPEDTP